MKIENVILQKSADFAVRIVNLYKYISATYKDKVIVTQLLRSGTSIGANAEEADAGISKKDFLSKMYISLKEARETKFWLVLLHRTQYINDTEFESIYSDCIELIKLLSAITKTTKENLHNPN
ncbi:MAG: four helix bundle protein [Muribaculaceae bacterium]|nr:four helix bundle protein [Muribaculaceae bacterium]